MSPKLFSFFAICWVIGILWGITYDGASFINSGYEQSPRDTLSTMAGYSDSEGNGPSIASQKLPLIGDIPLVTPAVNFFKSAANIIGWQFSFVQPYPIMCYIFGCFGVMGLISFINLVFSIIRGNIVYG